MSDLLNKIKQAQMLAGENVVVDSLKEKGLLSYKDGIKEERKNLVRLAISGRIEEMKKSFSGSTDYLSGVNDGMYQLMEELLHKIVE